MHEITSQSENMLIKYAITRYAEDEGSTLNEENAKLKLENVYPLTQKNLKILRKTLRKKQRSRSSKRKNVLKFVGGYVAITAIIVSGFSVATAVHQPFLNLLLTDKNVALYLDDKDNNVIGPKAYIDWHGLYIPQYHPADATISSITNNKTIKIIGYAVNEHTIWFSQYNSLSELNIDREEAVIDEIYEKDFEATCLTKNDLTNIVWYKENKLFLLTGPSEFRAELIKMAKSIVFVE